MKFFCPVLFFALLYFNVCSQNYRTIYPGRITNYNLGINQDTMILQIKPEVDTLIGVDTVFKNFTAITLEGGAPFSRPPWEKSDTSFFAYKFCSQQNGTDFFLNSSSDTVFIQTQSNPGDSWRMYTYPNAGYIQASVQQIDLFPFLNISDSAKEISLQRFDSTGNPVADPLNSVTLHLSKSFGLLNLPDFAHFPVLGNLYQLAGFDSTTIGIQSLSMAEIFDFDIGDVFQYYKTYTGPNGSHVDYYQRTILAKIIDTTSGRIQYAIQDTSIGTLTWWMGGTTIYFVDQVDSTLYFCYPGECIYSNPTISASDIYSSTEIELLNADIHSLSPSSFSVPVAYQYFSPDYNSRMLKHSIQRIFLNLMDSTSVTFDTSANSRCNSRGIVFGKGLGFVKITNEASGMGGCVDSMIYFKKGNETWGTPVNLLNILGTNKNLTTISFRYFPNPFIEKLSLNDLPQDTRTVQLYSIDGKLIDELKPAGENSCQFNTQHVNPGLYILSVKTSDAAYHLKVIKGN